MNISRKSLLTSAFSLVAAGTLGVLSLPAFAGECPADKVAGNAMKPGAMKPVGVSDTVIASIDLARKADVYSGQLLRMRRLEIAPGGEVPWHSHGERPAIIYVISGEMTEYRSTCAVPIVHKSGEVVAEFGKELSHWWRNNTNGPAVLISADIFQSRMKDDPAM